MSETSQNEKKPLTGESHIKDQGKFFLKSDIAKRLISPWLLYIPFAGAYISWSLKSIMTEGFSPYVTPFCLPINHLSSIWCYPAEPCSMIVLSLFMIGCIPRFGWFSGLIAASAGMGYDMTGGGIYPLFEFGISHAPVTMIQLLVLFLPFIVLREKISFSPSIWLVGYLGAGFSGLWVNVAQGPMYEPFLIGIFCFSYFSSISKRKRSVQS